MAGLSGAADTTAAVGRLIERSSLAPLDDLLVRRVRRRRQQHSGCRHHGGIVATPLTVGAAPDTRKRPLMVGGRLSTDVGVVIGAGGADNVREDAGTTDADRSMTRKRPAVRTSDALGSVTAAGLGLGRPDPGPAAGAEPGPGPECRPEPGPGTLEPGTALVEGCAGFEMLWAADRRDAAPQWRWGRAGPR